MNTPRIIRSLLLLACAAALAPTTSLHAAAPAAKSGRPNILFIIFDDWGGSTHSSASGNSWIKTPNFDRVAREGVLFKNAFTSNPKCSPCRASILTGRNSWQLREAVSHGGYFPSGFEVYPDLLEKSGYFIGLTGKGWGPGDYKTLAKRQRNPAGPLFDGKRQNPPASGISATDYPGNFEDFLKQRPVGKPFCFWMGFHEPHRGYERGSGVRAGKSIESVKVPAYLPDNEIVRGDLLDYAVEVEWGDAQIGRALKVLEATGELDHTLIVVTSDHGMPFPFVKGQIFEDAFHIPMAMRWGNATKGGRVVDDFINMRDLAPTYMELAGMKPHAQMTGRSLVNILRSGKTGFVENRDWMLTGKERHDIGRPNDLGYPVRALRTKDFLYVHNFHPERWPAGNPETDFGNVDPSPTKEVIKKLGGHYYELALGKRPPDELFRMKDDPECVRNLANDLAFTPVLEEMRARMMKLLREEEDPRALGNAEIFDTYEYVGGRNKGYETWMKAQQITLPDPIETKKANPRKEGKKKDGQK